jgi:hypothetical protein
VLRQGRWAATGRGFWPASTLTFFGNGSRKGASPCGGLSPKLAARGLKVDYRTVWSFVRSEGLSFKKNHSAK